MNQEVTKQLFHAASEARLNAYAPYSKFLVGAALVTDAETIVTGCNVENASYGHTICAERTAICKAVSEGMKQFTAILIVTDGAKLSTPCGACLQVMQEFGPHATVVCCNLAEEQQIYALRELYPYPFGPADLM